MGTIYHALWCGWASVGASGLSACASILTMMGQLITRPGNPWIYCFLSIIMCPRQVKIWGLREWNLPRSEGQHMQTKNRLRAPSAS